MINDTLTRLLETFGDTTLRYSLRNILSPIFDRQVSRPLTTAGLVIKTGGSALAKTGAAATYYVANGVPNKIAAATDMPALVGTVTNATFNVYCFYGDAAGTITSVMGTKGASLALVKFPQAPQSKAFLGFIVINPTGTGDFVGGTTALDDATVVPNAAYISLVAGFDPYCLIGL